jgi:phosphate transport system substrate-binding protein
MTSAPLYALLLLALALCCTGIACTEQSTTKEFPPGVISLHGAGATFPAPLYKKWIEVYQQQHPDVALSYDAVGSGDGIKQFIAGAVDFGASDAAMRDGDIAQVERGVQLVPVVAGSIVLAYNLPGLGSDLRLKRDVYVDMFLGRITRWDDPRIRATNPNLNLPKANIALVTRQDSKGEAPRGVRRGRGLVWRVCTN